MRRVKKKKQTISLKSKVWFLIVLALIGGGVWFYRSEYKNRLVKEAQESYVGLMEKMQLVLKKVKVKGHIRTELKDIHQVTNLSQSMPIFDVDLKEIHEKISALPWIKSVLIERQLPSSLVITVMEKTPIAMWQNNKKYMPLDEEGHPIPDEKTKLSDLILVVGGDAPEHTVELLNTLKNYPLIRERVKSAVRVGNRRWNLRLDAVDGLVVELPEKDVANALERLQKSIQEDKLFQKDITSVNLREGDRLIVTTGGKK
ncbi:MAG: FtsQ-type POTRA domain-containing protein [Alphaproteobacteria bacterium]|nr:FtsQ-type POTRA domain-containing protein [Alphaproteobacteria bacterium]